MTELQEKTEGRARKLTDEEYLAHDGVRCPFCRSRDIVGESVEINVGSATQDVYCNVCEAEWYDEYKLVAVHITAEGDSSLEKPEGVAA